MRLAAFVVFPMFDGLFNVFLLAFFRAATQKQNDSQTIFGQINSKPGPPINTKLTNPAKPLNVG